MDYLVTYHTPKSIADAAMLLKEHGTAARLLAGGQILIPELRNRRLENHAIVDLGNVNDLDYIRVDESDVRIGAMCRYASVTSSNELCERAPGLVQALANLASAAIRNRSTIGGNLAQADRRSTTCAVCVLLDAKIKLMGGGQTIEVPILDYLRERQSGRQNVLLCEVMIPISDLSGFAFSKFALHPHEYPLMSVGVKLSNGRERDLSPHVVIGGPTSFPQRAAKLEKLVRQGAAPSDEELTEALGELSFAPENGLRPDYLHRALVSLAGRTIRSAFESLKVSQS